MKNTSLFLRTCACVAFGAAGSCNWGSNCPEVPARPTPHVYEVFDATDLDLIGARVTVTADLVTIEYERDGVPVTVVYQVGDAT